MSPSSVGLSRRSRRLFEPSLGVWQRLDSASTESSCGDSLLKSTISSCQRSVDGLDKQHSVDTAVILRVVGDLGVLAPNNLTGGRHETQLGHIHFQNAALRDDA